MKQLIFTILILVAQHLSTNAQSNAATFHLTSVIQTAKSGNWSDADTWLGGMIPLKEDDAIILTGHTVSVDATVRINNLMVNTGGKLLLSANDTLYVGPLSGGKQALEVNGSLEITGGMLTIGGNLLCNPGSTFTMTGGLLRVDGNDGTTDGSVAAGKDIARFSNGMAGFQFTGGTLLIVDPPFDSTGKALSSSYDFGEGSTLQLGDTTGTSIAPPQVYGFGAGLPQKVGNLVFVCDTVYGSSHYFRNTDSLFIQGNCIIEEGTFVYPGFGGGAFVIASPTAVAGDFVVKNSVCLGIKFPNPIPSNLLVSGNLLMNHAAVFSSVAESNISIEGNIVNDGWFEMPYLYLAKNYGQEAVSHKQVLGGRGYYHPVPHGYVYINNASPEGVSLDSTFSNHDDSTFYVLTLNFIQGKFYLGNKKLDVYWYMTGANADRYVVTGEKGQVTMQGYDVSAFIGFDAHSYNPVVLKSGTYSHKYALRLKQRSLNQGAIPGLGVEWEITNLEGASFPVSATFQWTANQEDSSFDRSKTYVAKYMGTSWQALTDAALASGSDPFTRTVAGLSSFSWFTILSGANPLPVEMSNLTARQLNGTVQLEWTVASETNLTYYEVERAGDGMHFISLGTVKADNRVDNSKIYRFTDYNPYSTLNYYRLRMTDFDGRFTYSKVLMVKMTLSQAIEVYPNPATDLLYLQCQSGSGRIQILNAAGSLMKVIEQNQAGNHAYVIDISDLPKGVYFIKARSISSKFIKE